ncbi:MAG: lysoplasmalogenase [Maribacter sp.]
MTVRPSTNQWIYALFIAQIVLAVMATATNVFVFKISVAGIGVVILLLLHYKQIKKEWGVWMVILALLFSIVGDYFLSHMNEDGSMFIIGIGLYLLAHIGYLLFSLFNGRIKWGFTLIITLAYLAFFYQILYPNMSDKTLVFMVLFYLLVSCVSLGAALGINAKGNVKWFYVLGISMILLSDTIISFKEFMDYHTIDFLILPTYYVAQICITIALFNKMKKWT